MSEIIAGQPEINAQGREGMKNKMSALSPVIEEAFIQVVIERMKMRGLSHSQFAHSLWPDVSKNTALGRWRDMRVAVNKTGKRMTVSLENAMRMAASLHEDIWYLLVMAQEYAVAHNLVPAEELEDCE